MDESPRSKLRAIRERAGISQDDLSSKASIPQNTLSRWESGQGTRSILAAIRVARALGVPVEVLFRPARTRAKPRTRAA